MTDNFSRRPFFGLRALPQLRGGNSLEQALQFGRSRRLELERILLIDIGEHPIAILFRGFWHQYGSFKIEWSNLREGLTVLREKGCEADKPPEPIWVELSERQISRSIQGIIFYQSSKQARMCCRCDHGGIISGKRATRKKNI